MRMSSGELERRIVYEDEAVIVVWKPAGVAVQSARVTEPDLIGLLLLREQMKGEGKREIRIVHRLDQPVEGMMVFAGTKEAAAALSRQLTDGSMKKIYRAVVDGIIPADEGILTDYLLEDPKTNTSKVVPAPKTKSAGMHTGKRPRRAVLAYKKIAENEVEIELGTGRRHQIRVQLAHAGMPVRGDRKYGPAAQDGMSMNGEQKTGPSARTRLYLKSYSLSFIHPVSGERVTFTESPSGQESGW